MNEFKSFRESLISLVIKSDVFVKNLKKLGIKDTATIEEKFSFLSLLIGGGTVFLAYLFFNNLSPEIISTAQSLFLGFGIYGIYHSGKSMFKTRQIEKRIENNDLGEIEKKLVDLIINNENIVSTENNAIYFSLKKSLSEINLNKVEMEEYLKKIINKIGKEKMKIILNDPELVKFQKNIELGNGYYLFLLSILAENIYSNNKNAHEKNKVLTYLKENHSYLNEEDIQIILNSSKVNEMLAKKRTDFSNKRNLVVISNLTKSRQEEKQLKNEKIKFEQEYILNLINEDIINNAIKKEIKKDIKIKA